MLPGVGARRGARVAEGLGELGDVAPRDLRAEEHAVGQARRARGRAHALRAHLERRVRPLVRRKAHARGGDRV